MTTICNFPISKKKRCKQPVSDGRPNCGRHKTSLSVEQLGQNPIVYQKDRQLHVWAGEPDGLYCLIHNDPAYQTLYQLAGEMQPCCLREDAEWKDEHGKLHRNDGPAVIDENGTQRWYQHGKLHRNDGPAIIYANGSQAWYQYGKWHRDGGPAFIGSDGSQEWYQHGKLYRDDGPAAIDPDGTQEWWWYDKLHRDDGPARIYPDGTQEWWWHGEEVTKEEHAKLRAQSSGRLISSLQYFFYSGG